MKLAKADKKSFSVGSMVDDKTLETLCFES